MQVRPRRVRGLEPSPEGDGNQLLGGGAGGPRTNRPWRIEAKAAGTTVSRDVTATRARGDARAEVTAAQPTIVVHAEPRLWSQPADDVVSNSAAPALAA